MHTKLPRFEFVERVWLVVGYDNVDSAGRHELSDEVIGRPLDVQGWGAAGLLRQRGTNEDVRPDPGNDLSNRTNFFGGKVLPLGVLVGPAPGRSPPQAGSLGFGA